MPAAKPRSLILAATLCLAANSSCGGDAVASELPPNIIVFSLDTLRRDHVGFHGYERDTTPFLDEFARKCVIYERAYTTASWTLIAHMSLLTGLYPSQHQVWNKTARLTPEFTTLAERLEAYGYDTRAIYFEGWIADRFGFARGFGEFDAAQSAEEAQPLVAEAIEARRTNRPFFWFIHLFDIHSKPLNVESTPIYEAPAPFGEKFMAGAEDIVRALDVQKVWNEDATHLSAEQHEAIVALYDGGISYVDHVLQGWFETWEAEGLLDNTIVVITSDHGESLLDHGIKYGGHGGNYEEGLLVPMLLRLPDDARAGERFEHPVSHVDLVPTLLDLVGLEGDDRLPGHSLLGDRPGDEFVFAQRESSAVAIRDHTKIRFNAGRPSALFDLERDPDEMDPFLPKHDQRGFKMQTASLIEDIQAQLEGFYDPGAPASVEDLTEDQKVRLRGLGYADVVGDN